MYSLNDIKKAQPKWFSKGNKKFFNDVRYYARVGKVSNKTYLVIATFGWTDMFDRKPVLHYRIKPIEEVTKKILPLVDTIFNSMSEVKTWLNRN